MKTTNLLILLLLLFTDPGYSEEVCEIDRSSIVERVENRSYPSTSSEMEYVLLNYPRPDDVSDWSYIKEMLAHHDLFVGGLFRGLQWRFGPEGSKVVAVGEVQHEQYLRNQLQELNPNFLYLATMFHYGAAPDVYPEEWPYWLRDESGNRLQDPGYAELLIDYTHPGAQDHFIQRAIAIAQCGIFDGIFLDWWAGEDREDTLGEPGTADLYHSNTADARISLLRRIREAVGDDFLIIANTNTYKVPSSAPYLNGAFMETFRDDRDYSREYLIEIEDALSWYEENFRYPQVNCLSIQAIPDEPLDSVRNQQQAQVFTSLSLTHSNGYILYKYKDSDGYWYPFWDADLGKPIGEKAQLYENREGLFIREFTNGWAVYNRSGKEQQIEFSEMVSGVASGGTEKHSHVIPDLDGEIYLKVSVSVPADINVDGIVNILDLVLVANAFGDKEPDLNGDGTVNILDLVLVANAFGGP